MTEYSEHIKAQAMAALLAGASYTQVAQQFGVPTGTLKSWKRRDVAGLDEPDASGATTKRRIGQLLLGYLEDNLTTLQAQAVVFRDEEWLKKQPAGEAAVLHGVLADKAIRLLEALEGDPDPSDDVGAAGGAAGGGVRE